MMCVLSEWRTFIRAFNCVYGGFGWIKSNRLAQKTLLDCAALGLLGSLASAGHLKGAFVEDQTRGFI
jgi:hypothetical protein